MIKFILCATILLSSNLFAQMKSNTIGWASFFNEASTKFSYQFQREMANQLMDQFNAKVEIDSFAQNKGFTMFVGMEDLKIMYKDGYAFALVEVIAPNTFTKLITIFWKADDNKKITKSRNVNSLNVQFGWCTDFDTTFFRSFAQENVIEKINGVQLFFKFVADFQLFPDLTIQFEFKEEPTKEQLKEIEQLALNNYSQSRISFTSENKGKHFSIIDFQSTDFEAGLQQIEQFILAINSIEVGQMIKSITIK